MAIDLFEFMDLNWLPASLRDTLREILEAGNSAPFRSYFIWVARETCSLARDFNANEIVELGAGTAPNTRAILAFNPVSKVVLSPCDIYPDETAYRELARQFPNRVKPVYTSVNFAFPREWSQSSLLLLSATFHHIPIKERPDVLSSLMKSKADTIIVFEPLRHNLVSLVFVLGSLPVALLLPLLRLNRCGIWRRLFWCWLFPAAPLIFLWEGWASCLRCWTKEEWLSQAAEAAAENKRVISVRESLFCQEVVLTSVASCPS